MATQRRLLTIGEAARSLGRAEQTLRRQARLGKLAAVKHGRDWYITEGEVERYRIDNRRDDVR